MNKPFFPLLEPNAISTRRRSLPHWETWDATYFVTFRLYDSLPAAALARYGDERKSLLRRMEWADIPSRKELEGELSRLFDNRIGRLLNEGRGDCALKRPEAESIVSESLAFFNGQRYELHAYVVMPNHVHVLFRVPQVGDLAKILHSWKSFTANAINRTLGRSGPLWQHEYFDHLIRGEVDLEKRLRYILDNPAVAGLVSWPWVWSAFDENVQGDERLPSRLEAGATLRGTE